MPDKRKIRLLRDTGEVLQSTPVSTLGKRKVRLLRNLPQVMEQPTVEPVKQPVVETPAVSVEEPKNEKRGSLWHQLTSLHEYKKTPGYIMEDVGNALDPFAGLTVGAVESLIPGKQSGEKIWSPSMKEGFTTNPVTQVQKFREIRQDPNLNWAAGMAADIANPTSLVAAATAPRVIASGMKAVGMKELGAATGVVAEKIGAFESGKAINPIVRESEKLMGQVKKPLPPKMNDAVAIAEEHVRQDAPSAVAKIFGKVPGVKQVRQYERPGLKMQDPKNKDVLVGMISKGNAEADIMHTTAQTREPAIKTLEKVFGKNTVNDGMKVDALFVGTKEQAAFPDTGTLFDVIQRPNLYNLSARQKKAIEQLDLHNTTGLRYTNEGYGTTIGEYRPQEGYWLPNARRQEDVADFVSKDFQSLSSGRSKERFYETGAERWANDIKRIADLKSRGATVLPTEFRPELNIRRLIEGADRAKASAAGGVTFRSVLGGKTKLDILEELHPKLTTDVQGLRKKIADLQDTKRAISDDLADSIDNFNKSPMEEGDVDNLVEALKVQEKDPTFGVRVIAKDRDNIGTIVKVNGDNAQVYFKNRVTGAEATVTLPMDQLTTLSHGLPTGTNLTEAIASTKTAIADAKEALEKLRPAWRTANTDPYKLVKEGNIYRYFEPEKAGLIQESLKVSNNKLLNILQDVKATAFGGDFSPIIGVQTSVGMLAHPQNFAHFVSEAVKNKGNLIRMTSPEYMIEQITKDPVTWRNFAIDVGRPPLGNTAEEFAGGFLRSVPGYSKLNDSMYRAVTLQQKWFYDDMVKTLTKSGLDEKVARAAAGDMSSKVFPLASPARLGQSQAQYKLLSTLPTSYSFIRQPAKLMSEAATGFAKLATKQPLSPREKIAVRVAVTMSAMTMGSAAATAALSAKIRGQDPKQAALDAVNPYSKSFLNLTIGEVTLPTGGPFRSILRATLPDNVDGVPIPVPFAGMVNYGMNRMTPAIKAQYDLVRNRDFKGYKIRKGDPLEQAIRGVAYLFESTAPLTAGEAIEGIRTGEDLAQTIENMGGQFVGVNATKESDWAKYTNYVVKLAQQEWEATGDKKWLTYADEPVSSYEDLKREKRLMNLLEEKYPNLIELRKDAQSDLKKRYPNTASSKYYDMKEEYSAERAQLLENVQEAFEFNPDYEKVKEGIKRANEAYHNSLNDLDAIPEFTEVAKMAQKKSADNLSEAWSRYLSIFTDPKYISPTGEIDYEGRDSAMKRLQTDIGAEMWTLVEENQRAYHENLPDIVRKYYSDQEALRPYWDIEDQIYSDWSQKPGYGNLKALKSAWAIRENQLKQEYIDSGQTDPQRLNLLIKQAKFKEAKALIQIEPFVAQEKAKWKAQHKEEAMLLKLWYGS